MLDGFGSAPDGPGNAVAAADTPFIDQMFSRWPSGTLAASGLAVGLPEGQMGNSEVGHLNIGAGRVVYQELTRIDRAVAEGGLRSNAVLRDTFDASVAGQRAVHLMGLVSDGGVHSHIEHLLALVDMARERGVVRLFVHCFLDGRDVSPTSGAGFLDRVESHLGQAGIGRVSTVMGRYFAMDRDRRWDRVERAWRAMVLRDALEVESAAKAVRESYARGVTDEFVEPVCVRGGEAIADGDAVLFFNFRPDRARQIARAFVDDDGFDGFDRPGRPAVRFVCLTEYDPGLPAEVAFEKELPCCVLADVVAEAGLRQLHIAETEKYAHVTFFFNGGSEPPKTGEERILVPSPRVPTYDLQPEMSAPEVTRELVRAIREDRADLYVVNYANCDMVGHTGDLEAAVKAVEAVDAALEAVVEAVLAKGGSVLVTADHGNAERMIAADGGPLTAHTACDVPFVAIGTGARAIRDGGILADIAPTVAGLLGIEAPPEWTGSDLLLY